METLERTDVSQAPQFGIDEALLARHTSRHSCRRMRTGAGPGMTLDACPDHDDPHPNVSERSPLATGTARIPSTAHFIWYGANFPWVHALAVRSALARGGFARVVLHAEPQLAEHPQLRELHDDSRFELRTIEPRVLLEVSPDHGPELLALYRSLPKPVARANVLRAAILAHEGGVYLDMDTVTVGSLSPLRRAGAFCGQEEIAFPGSLARAATPWPWLRAGSLHAVRAICRRHPDGIELFRRFAHHYARAVNNAVLAATPGHPLMRALLAAMVALPAQRQQVRFALGTHLLQAQVERYSQSADSAAPETDLCVHPPPVFYPLPPEISQHWFRERARPQLDAVLAPETRVVHWYASVENRTVTARIDPSYVRAHAGIQLFSALALPFLGD